MPDPAGISSDIIARLQRLEASVSQPTEQAPAPVATVATVPFWYMIRCTGLTLTTASSLDWSPLFENAANANFHVLMPPIGRGCFDVGNLGFAYQRRLTVIWDAATTATIKLFIGGTSVYTGDADAAIQVKINGKMAEYAAGSGPFTNVSQIVSLPVKSGRNRLDISTDIHPDTLQVGATLWDETRGDAWVDPRQFFDHLRRGV